MEGACFWLFAVRCVMLSVAASTQAVCCEDHLHCCPHGTVCNLVASTCDDPSGSALTPLLSNTPGFPYRSENGRCDESASCPGEATCCRTRAGGWACCPLPQVLQPADASERGVHELTRVGCVHLPGRVLRRSHPLLSKRHHLQPGG